MKSLDRKVERIEVIVVTILILNAIILCFVIWKSPILTIEYKNQTCNSIIDTSYKQIENQVPLENFSGTYILDIYGKGYYEYNELPKGNYTLLIVYREVCGGLGYEGGCRYIKENLYYDKLGVNLR